MTHVVSMCQRNRSTGAFVYFAIAIGAIAKRSLMVQARIQKGGGKGRCPPPPARPPCRLRRPHPAATWCRGGGASTRGGGGGGGTATRQLTIVTRRFSLSRRVSSQDRWANVRQRPGSDRGGLPSTDIRQRQGIAGGIFDRRLVRRVQKVSSRSVQMFRPVAVDPSGQQGRGPNRTGVDF